MSLSLSIFLFLMIFLEMSSKIFISGFIPESKIFINDKVLEYKLRHNYSSKGVLNEDIFIDEDAFRYKANKNLKDYRNLIIGIGDSFTFGSGVNYEQTYLYYTEKKLNNGLSEIERYSIINAGVPGYNLIQYELYLNYLLKRKPKFVTIGIIENDLYSLVEGDYESSLGINPYSNTNILSMLHRFLRRNSTFYRLIYFSVVKVNKKSIKGDKIYQIVKKVEDSNDFQSSALKGIYTKKTSVMFRKVEETLKRINLKCKKNGAHLVVLLIPRLEQILSGKLRKGYSIINNFCIQNNISVINVGEKLSYYNNKLDLYLYPENHHMSNLGHLKISELLSKKIIKLDTGINK